MRRLLLRYIPGLFFFISTAASAQPLAAQLPPNDDQCSAIDLGLLKFPAPCPFINNLPDTTITTNNNGASADYPYNTYPGGCPSLKDAKDIWFKFKAASKRLEIKMAVTSSMTIPTFALYKFQGGCSNLLPLCYMQGTTSAVKIVESLDVGEEYYLQVAGGSPTDAGSFVLLLTSLSTCDQCVHTGNLIVNPPPVKGGYAAGTTVSMCYTVSGYTNQASNRLHGIYPVFGTGWDLTSLTPLVTPNSADNLGSWMWSSIGGHNGYYYDADNNGNPADNLGDQNAPFGTSWKACWSIQTAPVTNCVTTNPLNVNVYTTTDHETGTQPNAGCSGDTAFFFDPWLNCCQAPPAYPSKVSCSGQTNDGSVAIYPTGTPYDYEVVDQTGSVVSSGTNETASPQIVNGLSEGVYQVYFFNTQTQCWATTSFTVEGNISADAYQTLFGCENNPNSGGAAVDVFIHSGSGPYTYVWDENGSFFATHTQTSGYDTISGLGDNNLYTVTITDSAGCHVSANVQIDLQPGDNVSFAYPQDTLCMIAGTGVNLLQAPAITGGIFSMNDSPSGSNAASTLTQSGQFVPDLPGTYVIEYTNQNISTSSCPGYAYDTVFVSFIPSAPSMASNCCFSICAGNTTMPTFTALPNPSNMLVVWYDNLSGFTPIAYGSNFTPPAVVSQTPGTYYYYALQVNLVAPACINTTGYLTYQLDVLAAPTVDAGADITICPNDTAQLSAIISSGSLIRWQPTLGLSDSTTATVFAFPDQTTVYYAFVSDPNPPYCTVVDSVHVIVDETADCFLHTYHGFTPNGDGHNDTWIIDGIDANDSRVAIYNRWGDVVWNATGYNNSTVVWSGHHNNGGVLPEGTYYFVISSAGHQKTGWVELTR